MGYVSFVYPCVLELESHLQYFVCNDVKSIFSQQEYLILEIEPCDFLTIFLRFWPFEPIALIRFFI